MRQRGGKHAFLLGEKSGDEIRATATAAIGNDGGEVVENGGDDEGGWWRGTRFEPFLYKFSGNQRRQTSQRVLCGLVVVSSHAQFPPIHRVAA
jgi:hypothetical protein